MNCSVTITHIIKNFGALFLFFEDASLKYQWVGYSHDNNATPSAYPIGVFPTGPSVAIAGYSGKALS